MNAAQIAKLQKKVAAEVSAKSKKRDAEEQAKKDAIYRTVELLTKKYPDRGAVIAVYQGVGYCKLDGRLIPAGLAPNAQEFKNEFELIERNALIDVSYWLLRPEIYKEQKVFMDWFVKHYAEIKILTKQVELKKDGIETLSSLHRMGGIFEDFQKTFPAKSMIDFIEGFKMVDRLMMDALRHQ